MLTPNIKIMLTAVFIFTHLVMAGTASAVLYIAFDSNPEQTGDYKVTRVIREPYFLNKYAALRCGMKERALLFSAQISRVKIPGRLTRRSGHSI
jgi:hypothetical protein